MLGLKKGRETSRLESFSDGVFAISATLLVVSLEVPSSYAALRENVFGFIAFGLSFTMLVLIWYTHYVFFRKFSMEDAWTVCLNGLLLFVVLFYVYPLKFLSVTFIANFFGIGPQGFIKNPEELGDLFIIYGSGFIVVFLCFALLYHHAYAQKDKLNLDKLQQFDAISHFQHHLIFVFVGFLSALLAAFRIGLNFALCGWIYMLLGPLCAWNGVRREKLQRKLQDVPS